jgi:hypothetical protein
MYAIFSEVTLIMSFRTAVLGLKESAGTCSRDGAGKPLIPRVAWSDKPSTLCVLRVPCGEAFSAFDPPKIGVLR